MRTCRNLCVSKQRVFSLASRFSTPWVSHGTELVLLTRSRPSSGITEVRHIAYNRMSIHNTEEAYQLVLNPTMLHKNIDVLLTRIQLLEPILLQEGLDGFG